MRTAEAEHGRECPSAAHDGAVSGNGSRARLLLLASALLAALALLASGCGGSGGTDGTSSSNGSDRGDPAKFVACMRKQGVTLPDPGSQGASTLDPKLADSPRFKKAQKACRSLLPGGGTVTPRPDPEDQEKMLAYARCMRSHGLPNFPDPSGQGGFAIGQDSGIDPKSAQFKAAQEACKDLLPGEPGAQGGPQPVQPSP
jgi:hypothetical protein